MSDDKDKKNRAERATSNVFTRLPQKVMQEMKEKRAKAATSSVLTKFTQNQIQEMKEAFTMIDQNRDGLIDVSDLKEMYSNLGYSPQDKILDAMVKEAPGQLNFTMFLSLFSEKLSGSVPSEQSLENMIKEVPNQLNFTAFLGIFSDKLIGVTPQDSVLQNMVKEAPGQLNFTGFLGLFSEKAAGTDPEETLKNAFAMFDSDNTGFIPEEYMKDLLENMGDNFTKDEIRQVWKEAPFSGGKLDYNAFAAKIKGKEDDNA